MNIMDYEFRTQTEDFLSFKSKKIA